MTTPFQLSERLVDDVVAQQPMVATWLGLPGDHGVWGDLGIAGEAAAAELARRYRDEFALHLDHRDPHQRRAALVLHRSLSDEVAQFEHGDHLEDLRHMASTFQRVSHIFSAMPKENGSDWEAITRRLATIDAAYSQYRDRLAEGLASGRGVARRQVRSVIEQASALGGDGSAFLDLMEEARGVLDEDALANLADAVDQARAAATDLGRYLETEYLPRTHDDDAVGEERYRRALERFVGRGIDPHETYEWGWDELHRLIAHAERIGAAILPGADLAGVTRHLEERPELAEPSPEDFVAFVDRRLQTALDDLDGTHFDVAPEIRRLDVKLAPRGSPLGAYYTVPSEDFTRPGAVWYSLGDQLVVPRYHHVSTAYHEGFPGHHLQVGTAMVEKERLSRAHRLLVWYPGYGEGWALYAERLMGELGYFERPEYEFGMIAKQLYRATRVVVDIGLHLGKAIPPDAPIAPGLPWSFEIAREYLRTFGFRTPAQAVAEVTRYLGWPGQAIAYKVGERAILELRRDVASRLGDGFDLKRFHADLLGGGSMPLDLLRQLVLEGVEG